MLCVVLQSVWYDAEGTAFIPAWVWLLGDDCERLLCSPVAEIEPVCMNGSDCGSHAIHSRAKSFGSHMDGLVHCFVVAWCASTIGELFDEGIVVLQNG